MGLGGRREKQRITDDPRNTKWINDESSPGQRLLRSMGWKPEGEGDGSGGDNRTGLMAHTSSKRLRVIPIAKSGMEGIGYRPNGTPSSTVGIGALPSSGNTGMATAASSIFSRLGSRAALQFVSAGSSKEVINRAKTEGGEFASLLQRLNASASATPAGSDDDDGDDGIESLEEQKDLQTTQDSAATETAEEQENVPAQETKEERRERRRKRKLEKEAKRQAKRLKKNNDNNEEPQTPVIPSVQHEQTLSAESVAPIVVVQERTVLYNPRMASRRRHLASKQMLRSDANAMAEILGIAPGLSSGLSTPGTASPYISAGSLPASVPTSKESSPFPSAATKASLGLATNSDSISTDKTRMLQQEKASRKAEKKAKETAATPAALAEVDARAAVSKEGSPKASEKKRRREA